MNNLITSILMAISNVSSAVTASIENITGIQVVKEVKETKKACNYAEKIIEIVDKYYKTFKLKDKYLYSRYKRRFEKYD